jgi:RNA polymerase sigma factor (sigma-70 family)
MMSTQAIREPVHELVTDRSSTTALLRACRAGDQRAWELLLRRYQRLIYTIPLRLGLGPELAADVFQQVCVGLLEHLHKIEQPERLGAWLATTAKRESQQLRRRERALAVGENEVADDLITALGDTAPLPDELLERIERQQEVRAAMASLEPRCRCLLSQLYFQLEPPSYAEVAAQLGVPVGSVGPTRARCLKKLQQVLEALEALEGAGSIRV